MSLAELSASPTVPGRVHRVGFGWINLGGTVYEQDRVLCPDGVSPVWWRQRRHWFVAADAEELIAAYEPELMILGTGWMNMLRVDEPALITALARFGCEFRARRTPEAVIQYQSAMAEGRRVVAPLHLTC